MINDQLMGKEHKLLMFPLFFLKVWLITDKSIYENRNVKFLETIYANEYHKHEGMFAYLT